MPCDQVQSVTVPSIDISKLRLANTNCLFQRRLEYGFQFALRARYDAKHLGRRGLLLHYFCKVPLRLHEFAGSLIKLLLNIDRRGNVTTGGRRFTVLGLNRSWAPRHVTSKSTRVKPSLTDRKTRQELSKVSQLRRH